ncbi:MAG TPA: Do family serine endopeptidase [Candidatus Polarisedimenticolaceae bacterium]|nr:Do family serine endopeptidase [Candidatus Polarisedimenticolaceae bacterium]
MNRKSSFAALLAVVGASIVFGMVLGGKLNAPPAIKAASATQGAAPAAFAAATGPTHTIALPDFSEIAASTLPAVVGVQNTTVDKKGVPDEGGDDDGSGNGDPDDPIFRFFFGPGGPHQQQSPRMMPRSPQRKVSSGSGFIITDDGYILTNNHVVEGATKLEVTLDTGEKYEADVVGTDPMIDLGLIKVNTKGKKLPTVPLGDSDSLRVGQWVMAVGNPLALERTVTVGVVSGKKRQVPIGDTVPALANFIQTDAAINFGNSGGPLLDGAGRVVGINTAIFRGEWAEGIGFAIPINEARKAAEELRAGGSVKRGYLGITMNSSPVNDRAKAYYKLPDTTGVIIAEVAPKGPAAEAGVRKNDVVRKIDGEAVKDNQDLLARIASRKPGETVRLEIMRDGEPVHVDVKLTTRPVTFDKNGNQQSEPDDDQAAPSSAQGLGIKVQAIPPALRSQLQLGNDDAGVLISSVDPESQAADEGLTPRQLVVSLDDKPIRSVADWNHVVKGLKPGDTVKVEVFVGGRTEFVFLAVPQSGAK